MQVYAKQTANLFNIRGLLNKINAEYILYFALIPISKRHLTADYYFDQAFTCFKVVMRYLCFGV